MCAIQHLKKKEGCHVIAVEWTLSSWHNKFATSLQHDIHMVWNFMPCCDKLRLLTLSPEAYCGDIKQASNV